MQDGILAYPDEAGCLVFGGLDRWHRQVAPDAHDVFNLDTLGSRLPLVSLTRAAPLIVVAMY